MQTKTQKPQGFTLVELLVVITIIGILATGAISMFTGAQQKARDSVRVTDLEAMKLSLEQFYGDVGKYPRAQKDITPDATAVDGKADLKAILDNGYINKIPKDPKTGQVNANTQFVYVYGAARHSTTQVAGQEFELSTAFENAGNNTSKSQTDNTSADPNRWETGVNIAGVQTTITIAGVTSTNNYSTAATAESAYVLDNY